MRRRLNVKFLILLVVGSAVAAGGIHMLHRFQERRSAGALLRRGEEAVRAGDLETAETCLGRYLAFRRDDDRALSDYALVLDRRAVSTQDRVRALGVLERAVARVPERPDLRRRAVDLAMLPEIRRYRDARDHLQVLLKATPEDGELEGLLGRCLEAFASGEDTDAKGGGDAKAGYQAAAAMYADSIKHAPKRVESYVRLAGLLRGPLKDAARADRIMDAREADPGGAGLIARNPDSAAAHLARARYRKIYGIAGAEADVARALALAPADAEALLAAAAAAEESGDRDAARRHAEAGIAGHPKDRQMYLALSTIESRAGRFKEAAACLRKGLEALPDEVDLRWTLADVLILSGDLNEASTLIAELRKRENISTPAVDYLAARVLLRKGELAAGVRMMERARALLPDRPGVAALRALADVELMRGYERLGNPDRQLAVARRVLAADPPSLPARIGEASALLTLGRPDEALESYKLAAPKDGAARAEVARLLISRNARRPAAQADWAEVDRALDEAQAGAPDPARVAFLRASSLAARGQSDRAREVLERARAEHPKVITPWLGLAGLASASKGPEGALAVLDEAAKAVGDGADLRLARAAYLAQRGGAGAVEALGRLAEGIDGFPAPDRGRLLQGLADATLRAGDRAKARALYARAAEAQPDDVRLAVTLFNQAREGGPADSPEVRAAIERLRRIEGDEGVYWRFAEAECLTVLAGSEKDPRLGEARRLIGEVVARRPEWRNAPILDAEIAERERNPARALEAYQKAIDLGARDLRVVRRTVQLLYEGRRYAEAERIVQRVAEEGGDAGVIGQLSTELAMVRGDREGALERARRAIPRDSKDYHDHLWLGQVLDASGRADEAGAEIERAVELAGDRPEVWVAYVQYLVRNRRKADAEAAIARAEKQIRPELAGPALARCYELVGRINQAESKFLTARGDRAEDPASLANLAEFYARNGKDAQAEPIYRKLLLPETKAPEAIARLARLRLALLMAGQGGYAKLREGLALLDEGLARRGDDVEYLRARALLLGLQTGGRRDAIRAFEDLAKRQAPSPEERVLLARLYELGHEPAKAGELLRTALLASPEPQPRHIALYVRNLLARKLPDEAEPWLARLEKAIPDRAATAELRARLLAARGRGAEAADLIREVARETKNVNITKVGALLEELGQLGPAEASYREAAAGPGAPERILPLAGFLARHDRADEALDLLDKARATCRPEAVANAGVDVIYTAKADAGRLRRVEGWVDESLRKAPDSAELQFALANLRIYERRFADAEAILRRIIARDSQHGGPMNNLAWLLALQEGRGAEALDLVDRAVALEGASPDLLDTRALALLALGKAEPALKDLEEAVALDPKADKRFHLARAYAAAGRVVDAKEALRQARGDGLDASLHPLEQDGYRRLVADLDRK